jgi:hypothetical protein
VTPEDNLPESPVESPVDNLPLDAPLVMDRATALIQIEKMRDEEVRIQDEITELNRTINAVMSDAPPPPPSPPPTDGGADRAKDGA